MKNILLSKRYAKALFDLALSSEQLEHVHADMKLVSDTLDENRELRKLMTNPVVPPSRKKIVVRSIFGPHVQELSLAFLDILIRKGREQEIGFIATHFGQMYLDHKNIAIVNLTTAAPLEPALEKRISALIGVKTNKSISISSSVDPKLIGGFVLQMGDYQYDASIKRIIKRLHDDFDRNLFVKEF
jgi:F-type H+-transporting ATPase subunit delta